MQKLLQVLLGAGLLSLLFTMPSCKKNLKAGDGSAGASTAPRAIAYQLVWADEFNGTSLNTGNWNIDVGNPGVNSEQEYYQGANVTETGGNLVITARQQSVGGQPYTSPSLIPGTGNSTSCNWSAPPKSFKMIAFIFHKSKALAPDYKLIPYRRCIKNGQENENLYISP